MKKMIFADEMEKNQMMNLLNEYYSDTIFAEKTIESYEVDSDLYGFNPEEPDDSEIIQLIYVHFSDGSTSQVEYSVFDGQIY